MKGPEAPLDCTHHDLSVRRPGNPPARIGAEKNTASVQQDTCVHTSIIAVDSLNHHAYHTSTQLKQKPNTRTQRSVPTKIRLLSSTATHVGLALLVVHDVTKVPS